jgi:hypothetical protein
VNCGTDGVGIVWAFTGLTVGRVRHDIAKTIVRIKAKVLQVLPILSYITLKAIKGYS